MSGTATLSYEGPATSCRVVDVEIAVPVYNEADSLERSVRRLHRFLRDQFPLTWTVTVADNASTDQTWSVACRLARRLTGVRALRLDAKGRGRALRAAWAASPARVVAYMDVDLSTRLDALLPLVAPLLSGHSDLAIGSRLASGAHTVRGPKRELISRGYNLILKATLQNGFSDAQCGFKAVRADVARALLPLVEDDGWFFDTELLVIAERNGLRIHEVPVDWIDDPDSRVQLWPTARDDLKGIARLVRRFARGKATLPAGVLGGNSGPARHLAAGQVARFAQIGLVSTVAFAGLFVALRRPLGPIGADVVALTITGVLNLAANRRLTFDLQGRRCRRRHYTAGLVLAVGPLLATIATLVALGAAGVSSVAFELLALTLVNLCGAATRFALLRRWVFA